MATEIIRSARKIGLHHLAFWRGHLEGLDIADLGDLYLETGKDRVRAKATLRWLRDELVAAARRQAQPAIARLLRVPLEKLIVKHQETDNKVYVDLETFRVERDPDGFYSEKELIELFESEVNAGDPVAARKSERNNRLRMKLREATAWLENFICVIPKSEDPLGSWIDETVAARLNAAGLGTILDLTEIIRKRGKHWHRHIPKLGPIGAIRLQKWLAKNSLISAELVPVATASFVAPAVGIFPLERFKLPDDLTGAVGTNRTYSEAIHANNDRAAIEAWLASLGPRLHTVRNYRKEAERFLLWCIFELGKPMSSATVEDCTAYRDFLNELGAKRDEGWRWRQPPETWITTRNVPRWSEDWRPFSGQLSLTSQRQAVTVLKIMFEYLRRQRYLETNPWDGVSPILSTAPSIRKDHSLTPDQWMAVVEALDDYEEKDEAYFRLRFAILLGYLTGIRLDEMVHSKVADVSHEPGTTNPGLKPAEDGEGWVLEVIGKGMKARTVPMADTAMEALADYMEDRGLGRIPEDWPAGAPLLVTLPDKMQYATAAHLPMSKSAVYRMLKSHFKVAARKMPSLRDAGHLMQASTHWLRHTHATHSLTMGASIEDVRDNLGHASIATTSIYSHTGLKQRRAAINKLEKLAK